MFLLLSGSAYAQGSVDVQSFKTSPFNNDLFSVHMGEGLPKEQLNLGLRLNFQKNPFTMRDADTGKLQRVILGNQASADLAVAYSFLKWLDLGVLIPIIVFQDGDGWPTGGKPAATSIGDIRLVPRFQVVNVKDGLFALGILPILTFPTGKLVDDFSGAKNVAFVPTFAFSSSSRWIDAALNLFVRITERESVGDLDLYEELGFKAGLAGHVWKDRLDLIAEVFGATTLTEPFANINQTPMEGVGGLRWFLPHDLILTMGGGAAITDAYAAPEYRVFTGLQWSWEPDHDPDKDLLLDDADKCPEDPEDKDGFEDEDGCPEPDNDKDGIEDAQDKCPEEAEDKDGFQDEDGCPEPDNDQDGIEDTQDKCPEEAEDKDGFQDEDGCPELDNDEDGIPDSKDKCPMEAENMNNHEDEDGCPDVKSVLIEVTEDKIELKQKIFFKTGRAKIMKKSNALLDEIAAVLLEKPDVRVRIEGHTDNKGKAKKNRKLSLKRARAVKKYLVKKGVNKERMETKGYGPDKPIDSNRTKTGRSKNRRVEFIILK